MKTLKYINFVANLNTKYFWCIAVLFFLLSQHALAVKPEDILKIMDENIGRDSYDLYEEVKNSPNLYLNRQRSVLRRSGVEWDRSQIEYIDDYFEAPDSFSGLRAKENLIGIKKELDRLPPANTEVYSGQTVGDNSPIPKKGNYIVAKNRPWSFTESPKIGAVFLKKKMDMIPPKSETVASMYSIKTSLNGKPVATLKEKFGKYTMSAESEVLYPPGSTFRVENISKMTLKNGQYYYHVELSEVDAVPEGSAMIHYKGGIVTQAEIDEMPETIKIKMVAQNTEGEWEERLPGATAGSCVQ